MNAGARILLALTVGALAGSIAVVVSTRNDLVDNGVSLAVPIAGSITIRPQLSTSPQTLTTAAGVALVIAVVAFVVAGA